MDTRRRGCAENLSLFLNKSIFLLIILFERAVQDIVIKNKLKLKTFLLLNEN